MGIMMKTTQPDKIIVGHALEKILGRDITFNTVSEVVNFSKENRTSFNGYYINFEAAVGAVNEPEDVETQLCVMDVWMLGKVGCFKVNSKGWQEEFASNVTALDFLIKVSFRENEIDILNYTILDQGKKKVKKLIPQTVYYLVKRIKNVKPACCLVYG